MAVQVKPWQMKDADGNLLSPNTYTNTIYDPDGNLITNIATEREIGNAYDSSKTYPTYSPYCIHNNKFYKYSGASGTTTTGAWDSTKWTETPIANELSLLNSNLAALPKIQRGTASGSTGLISVTFDTAFSSTPTVVVSAYGTDSNANNRVAVVRAVSTVGFQAKVSVANTGGDASTSIMWIAVGA